MNIPTMAIRARLQHAARRARRGDRGEPRQLAVDERMVVPVGATVKMIVTSNDVIHAWGVPAFWTKIDAVPGRLNETWFRADREGVYLRRLLRTVRRPPRLHADRGRGGEPRALRRLGRLARAARCRARGPPRPLAAAPGRAGDPRPATSSRPARPPADHQSERSDHPIRRQRHDDRHHRKRRPFRGRSRACRASRCRSQAGLLRPLVHVDEPQGHRHALPDLRDHRRDHRRRHFRPDARPSSPSRASSICRSGPRS